MPEGSGSAGTLEAPPTSRLPLTILKTRQWTQESLTLSHWVCVNVWWRTMAWKGHNTWALTQIGSVSLRLKPQSVNSRCNVGSNGFFESLPTSHGEKVMMYFCSHCCFAPDKKIPKVDSLPWVVFVCLWHNLSVVEQCTFPVLKWNIYCKVICIFFSSSA